ncbi:hypothetical protein HanPI659440_Chr00c19g0734381 [Helianthus annuus]|nr:hypothetical protein HanPI659440_Chr00c19g0734381 [Helianthus annuus]
MGYNSTDDYLKILDELSDDQYSLPEEMINSLLGYVKSIYRSDSQNNYAKPMLWIGMYIAIASLVCILAMVADLLHGLRSRKLWFPCRFFRINAAYLSLIAIAMKLPVDLSGSMPGNVDQAGKLGSMAFMCTMMANLLPCLGSMDSNELLSNITALGILVITLVANVIIQIQTGVVSYSENARILELVAPKYDVKSLGVRKHRNAILAWIYVNLLLVLLIVHVCSCLAILKSKKIIQSRYEERHERASKDIQPSSEELTVDKLKKHVRNHWIMAGSGSPEFITACFRTTSASGVICVLVTVFHTLTISWTIKSGWGKDDFDSDYSWSMKVILIVQFIGVVIGTIAPLARCFATLSFQVSSNIISKYFKVFEVEGYWTSKLYEWRRASIKLPFRSRPKLEVVTESLKRIILRPCMELQEGVVVLCKIISLVPFVFMICIVYCKCCLKWLLKADNFDENKDLRQYVLPLENEMELADRTLDRLSKSVNRLIEKGEKARPQDLEILIKNSDSGLKGVAKFDHIDHHRVPSLLSKVQDQEFWSLPVVSLTTIAISLLEKESNEVKSLLKSVWEGLRYVTLVEESLNVTDDNVSLQKEADTLWKEVLYDRKWLGIDIQSPFFKEKSAKHIVECLGRDVGNSPYTEKKAQQIVEWFRDTSKNIDKIKGGMDDDPIHRSVCANSMYHITKTILLTYEANDDDSVSRKNLFDSLSSMIADIIAACLTNLPQVITKKCHNSAIEKWEDSVKDAALLLGETKEIIKTLYEDHGKIISGMNPSDLPFINKWRAHLGNP